MDERLQKILSQWGIASRRQAEQMILDGRVRLNGSLAHLGQRANPHQDQIEVDGVLVHPINRPQLIYWLMNKPIGVISTCEDPWNRKTVIDLLPPDCTQNSGIHPVGRLDASSTGALILTNDGELTYYLTHPSHSIPKTYRVWIRGCPSESVLEQWRQGVYLDGRLTRPATVTVLPSHQTHQTLLEIVLREGRNRQIRRVATLLGHPVLRLHRIAIGEIQLGTLPSGHYRSLTQAEIDSLTDPMASLETPVHLKKSMPLT